MTGTGTLVYRFSEAEFLIYHDEAAMVARKLFISFGDNFLLRVVCHERIRY